MILFDTAPIVAAAFSSERHHRACTDLLTGLRLAQREMYLPPTVAAEAGYLINQLGGPRREAEFLQGVAMGSFRPIDLAADDYARMAELVDQYSDLPLGTTDASVIALAERLKITDIATLDHRHFRVVRPTHVRAFTLPEAR